MAPRGVAAGRRPWPDATPERHVAVLETVDMQERDRPGPRTVADHRPGHGSDCGEETGRFAGDAVGKHRPVRHARGEDPPGIDAVAGRDVGNEPSHEPDVVDVVDVSGSAAPA